MALSITYVQEVLNHVDSTVVVDATDWPELLRLLKFEDRAEDLEKLVLGRMKLRKAVGGYAGVLHQLDALLAENAQLRAQVATLTPPILVPAGASDA